MLLGCGIYMYIYYRVLSLDYGIWYPFFAPGFSFVILLLCVI